MPIPEIAPPPSRLLARAEKACEAAYWLCERMRQTVDHGRTLVLEIEQRKKPE